MSLGSFSLGSVPLGGGVESEVAACSLEAQKFYIDADTGEIYYDFTRALNYPQLLFYQGDILPIEIYFVRRQNNLAVPLVYLCVDGFSPKVGISETPTGTPTTPVPFSTGSDFINLYPAITFQSGWRGKLDLSGAAVATFLGSLDAREGKFEVQFTDLDGFRRTVTQKPAIVLAEVNEG
jgi:hypothetical protein